MKKKKKKNSKQAAFNALGVLMFWLIIQQKNQCFYQIPGAESEHDQPENKPGFKSIQPECYLTLIASRSPKTRRLYPFLSFLNFPTFTADVLFLAPVMDGFRPSDQMAGFLMHA